MYCILKYVVFSDYTLISVFLHMAQAVFGVVLDIGPFLYLVGYPVLFAGYSAGRITGYPFLESRYLMVIFPILMF